MKQQIIAIHGGESFFTYEEYFSNLQRKKIDFDNLNFIDWKNNLGNVLGENYEVVLPRMPNAQNAKYVEWKIWFEKLAAFIRKDVILIGHSLGGVFLAKYLSEETFPITIKSTFLVAAPYDMDEGRPLPEFIPPASLEKFSQQGGKIHLYHSIDDPIVPFAELAKYQAQLPSAKVVAFPDRQHFNQGVFSEIVEDIKALS